MLTLECTFWAEQINLGCQNFEDSHDLNPLANSSDYNFFLLETFGTRVLLYSEHSLPNMK
jgi:hypothetical protein